MEELKPIGLINDDKMKRFYLDKFRINLTSDSNYQVYISKKHGGGQGKYEISNLSINGKHIVLSLNFKIGMLEGGTSAINQRVLFFKIKPNCEIIKVHSSN